MKLIEKLLLTLTIISFPTLTIAQTQIYSEFKTNDEENNIEVKPHYFEEWQNPQDGEKYYVYN